MRSLREHQSEFLLDIARLILFAFDHPDVALTAGDFNVDEKVGHMRNSLHYERLAADLNLFIKAQVGPDRWVWQYITGDHPMWHDLGRKWKSYNTQNRWGGDFKSKDFNHFSHAIDERA